MLIQQHNMSRLVLLPRIIHREGSVPTILICFSAVLCLPLSDKGAVVLHHSSDDTRYLLENRILRLVLLRPFSAAARSIGCDGFKFTPADVHLGGYQENSLTSYSSMFSVSGEVGRCVDGGYVVVMVYSSILVSPAPFLFLRRFEDIAQQHGGAGTLAYRRYHGG